MYVIDRRTLTMELPPRARRIRKIFWPAGGKLRTTSACAENTPIQLDSSISAWNYLRVRGEYGHADREGFAQAELPPRARRIRLFWPGRRAGSGTTSACAENTFQIVIHDTEARNYLRVRGEYMAAPTASTLGVELPPRARRILIPAAPLI